MEMIFWAGPGRVTWRSRPSVKIRAAGVSVGAGVGLGGVVGVGWGIRVAAGKAGAWVGVGTAGVADAAQALRIKEHRINKVKNFR